MAQVTIDGNTYDTYADVATADEYLGGSISPNATAWRGADADTKSRGLVSATRWLDEQNWLGQKTDPDQPLQWPRTGVDGVDPNTVPQAIMDACILLAAGLVADPEMRSTISQTATKRMKAGSVEIEYFRGQTVQIQTPFPADIMALIKPYLGDSSDGTGAGRFGGSKSFGTDRQDALKDRFDYSWGI